MPARLRKFLTRTHKSRAQFSIPKTVKDQLGLGREVKLIVDGPTGHFEGTKSMMSGLEIYGKNFTEKGFKKDQPITVVAARPGVRQPQKIRNVYLLPSESESELFEGGRVTVQVSRFERDPVARKRCIQIFGASCVVCGFDFSKTHGKIGAGFIHIHHLTPLSAIAKKYRVDARRDLRPVCPNCHEMLHRKNPPFSIKELAARISK